MVVSPLTILLVGMAMKKSPSSDHSVPVVPGEGRTVIPTPTTMASSSSSSCSVSLMSEGLWNRRDLSIRMMMTTMMMMGTTVTSTLPVLSANAFDGSGSTALSGYNPVTKAEKVKGYKQRVIADVIDFNRLGTVLLDNGSGGNGSGASTDGASSITSSKAWINFFITFQRREPDEYGRTYGALVDLRGLPTNKKYEYEGGDGLLLATSFTKPGKPSENTPAVKAWNKLFKTFDAIEAAGKKGDRVKARMEWEKTKPLLEEYLATVELPGDLTNPIYNSK